MVEYLKKSYQYSPKVSYDVAMYSKTGDKKFVGISRVTNGYRMQQCSIDLEHWNNLVQTLNQFVSELNILLHENPPEQMTKFSFADSVASKQKSKKKTISFDLLHQLDEL
jgi:hypothetical protein